MEPIAFFRNVSGFLELFMVTAVRTSNLMKTNSGNVAWE
jgi:hypothetical protein